MIAPSSVSSPFTVAASPEGLLASVDRSSTSIRPLAGGKRHNG